MDKIVVKHVEKTSMATYAKVNATVMKHKSAIMRVDVYKKWTKVKMTAQCQRTRRYHIMQSHVQRHLML